MEKETTVVTVLGDDVLRKAGDLWMTLVTGKEMTVVAVVDDVLQGTKKSSMPFQAIVSVVPFFWKMYRKGDTFWALTWGEREGN